MDTAQQVLGPDMALRGRFFQPFGSEREVLLDALAAHVHDAERRLRPGVAGFRRGLELLQRDREIATAIGGHAGLVVGQRWCRQHQAEKGDDEA